MSSDAASTTPAQTDATPVVDVPADDASASASAATKKRAGRAKKVNTEADVAASSAPASPSAATAAASGVSAGTSSRGRERKETQKFVPGAIKKSDDKLVIEAGPGTALGDIENVKRRLDASAAVDAETKALFTACFPGAKTGSTKTVIKKNIREFSGYVSPKDQIVAATSKLETRDLATLKLVCQILDLSESGTKAALVERITDFLKSPKATGHAYKHGSSSGGTKRKSKAKDGDKPKRGATSFMLFSSEFRAKVKEENPEFGMKECAVKLGEMWRELSDKKKAHYTKLAADLKAKSAGSASASEQSGSESEEEEEVKPKKKAKVEAAASSSKPMSADLKKKFNASIAAILKGADLGALSIAKVREQLIPTHGDLVEANKDAIKALILAQIASGSK